jgi:hypothetical protein
MEKRGRSKIANRFIQAFVLVFAIAVAVDVTPNSWVPHSVIRAKVRGGLGYLGLAQGEWSLFAPNPGMRTGFIVGEVRDGSGNIAAWTSPDWSQQSIAAKFLKFRHLNYYQRVVLVHQASNDLADYLQRSIPTRERVEPGIRLTEDLTIVPSDPIVPPIKQVILHYHHPLINLAYEEPIPKPTELVITETDRFLVKRDYPR